LLACELRWPDEPLTDIALPPGQDKLYLKLKAVGQEFVYAAESERRSNYFENCVGLASDLSTRPRGCTPPAKLANTPCANVTPRGQGCVAASYVCLLLNIKGYYCIHGKCIIFSFCGSKFSRALPQTPLGELTALPRPRSCWGLGRGLAAPFPITLPPPVGDP